MTKEELSSRFTYHPPKEGQPETYEAIRDAGYVLAKTVELLCPESREKSLAFTKIEEAVMWANASVARNNAGN